MPSLYEAEFTVVFQQGITASVASDAGKRKQNTPYIHIRPLIFNEIDNQLQQYIKMYYTNCHICIVTFFILNLMEPSFFFI